MPLFPPNRLGTLHFLCNNFINFLTIYYLLQKDVFQFELFANIILPVKPLFSLLVTSLMQFCELSLILFTQMYCLFYGPEVIKILNSPLFDTVSIFRSKTTSVKIVAIYLLLNMSAFLINFSHHLIVLLERGWPQFLESLASVLVLFTIHTNAYFYMHLFLYLQYGTYLVLAHFKAQLEKDCRNSRLSENVFTSVHSQLRLLALKHEQVVSLIAFPFIFLVLMLYVGAINCLALAAVFYNGDPLIFVTFFHPITSWGYLLIITILNRKNLQVFDQLVVELSEKQLVKIVLKNDVTVFARGFGIISEQNKQYREYFTLKLFNLIKINNSFILTSVLFVLNFVVFVVQTK